MKDKGLSKYIVFWLSQLVSQLGSSMTGTGLILWAFTQKQSAMVVSLMTFCNFVPYIIVSLFAGAFVDRHNKKKIMLCSDSIAAACSLFVLCFWLMGELNVMHIYMVNFLLGFMNAFQQPASAVAIGRMVPEKEIGRVSGMNSFSTNLITVIAPVLAAALYAWNGLDIILIIDFASFLFAFFILVFYIHIPESAEDSKVTDSAFEGCRTGFKFLLCNKGLWYIVITMAVMNFLSRLTYENILSAMVLARSSNNSIALGVVNAAIGIGGIVGGMIVSTGKMPKDRIKTIYISAALSFLMGDLLMGFGRNFYVWSIAGIAASLPIPFIMTAQNMILYEKIPKAMQGRVFAVRNAIQFGTIPFGILLGGFLSEYVLEPFMQKVNPVTLFLTKCVGSGSGSGMAVMFLCTGITGFLFNVWVSRRKEMDELRFVNTVK